MFKHTKIGATIGPACQTPEIIEQMVKAGMNFARLNFAHGTYDTHTSMIQTIRKIEEKTGEPIAVLVDLQGPRIRIGTLPENGVEIAADAQVEFSGAISGITQGIIPLDHPDLYRDLAVGERMLIDDGKIEVQITELDNTTIRTTVIQGGRIMSHKGINLPDSALHIPALSQKDKDDLRFAVKAGIEMVGMSFVSQASDILDIRFLIEQYAKEEKIKLESPIFIVAKIERHEAVKNIKEILDVVDGIMVARGDLGLELPAAEVPLVQKQIIDLANAMAKPVIVATQMLGSMQTSRRPTRAEVSDVANAVIDHADALLLTNETASGEYPVLAVQTMTDIILATEKSHYDDTNLEPVHRKGTSTDGAIAAASRLLAEEVGAKLIVAASLTGETGRLISHLRPELSILVATSSTTVWRQLNLSWGVRPFILPECRSLEELMERSTAYIKQHKIAKVGDKMIVVAGEPVGQAGNVNLVEVREIK